MIDVNLKNIDKVGDRPRVVSTPYLYAVAEGNIPDHYTRRVLGYRGSLTNGAWDDISEIDAVLIPLPTVPTPMEVVGAAADTYAGVGGQVVEVHGLNARWEEESVTVRMAGATPVAIGTFRRINNIHVMQVGANGIATDILCSDVATHNIDYSRILAGNISLSCHYTIPANTEGYIVGWSAGSTGAKPTRFVLRVKRDWNDGELTPVYHSQDIITADSSYTAKQFQIPIKCPSMSDIKISGWATGAGASASGSIEIWLEKI